MVNVCSGLLSIHHATAHMEELLLIFLFSWLSSLWTSTRHGGVCVGLVQMLILFLSPGLAERFGALWELYLAGG